MLRLIPLLLAATASAVSAAPANHEPCVALVVGNSNYLPPQRKLANTINDARMIGQRLETGGGCAVTAVLDLITSESQAKLDAFIAGIEPGTTVYFYYSGHGVQMDDDNILVSVDVRAVSNAAYLRSKSIPFRSFLARISARNPRVIVAIIDACRERLAMPDNALDAKGLFVGLALAQAEPNTVLIYATAKSSLASGTSSQGNLSLFTASFLNFFRRGEDLYTTFHKTKEAVVAESGGAQRPWMDFKTTDRVCLGGACGGNLGAIPLATVKPPVACKSSIPFPFIDHNRWGYLNCDGAVAVPAHYLSAWPFSTEPGEKRAPVRDPASKKYGYIDLSGKLRIEAQYDGAYEFRGGLAPVRQNGKWFFIGLTGKQQTPLYENARPFKKGLAPVQVIIEGKRLWGYISTRKTAPDSSDRVFAIAPQFEDAQEFSEEGVAAVKVNGAYGFIDRSGNMIVKPQFEDPPRYDEVMIFHSGLCPAMQGGLWGFIDPTGAWSIQPRYTRVKNFHDGLAAVEMRMGTSLKWGYVDTRGDLAISPSYDNAYDFHDGVAIVKQSEGAPGRDRLTPINREGTFLVPRERPGGW